MENKENKCEHFFLPYQIISIDKAKQCHDLSGNAYRWRDIYRVEEVYCAKCGKICYSDLSDLKS